MTTETFNPNTLPYKLTADSPTYLLPPTPELHMLMCDLTKKIPSLRFVATGRTFIQSETYSDEFNVFANTEKVGALYRGSEYRDGKYTPVFGLRSPRISQGRGGRSHVKKTIHYKVALREALKAFAPPKDKELVTNILSIVDDRVGGLTARAIGHMDWSLKSALMPMAEYIASVEDHGPQVVPSAVREKMGGSWREKLNTCKITKYVCDKMKSMDGVALKLMQDGTFIAVNIREQQIITTSQNPYDLPENYQTKFAVLKMMEKDQAVANAGVKVEFDGAMYFYMTDGDMEATTQ